MVSMAPSSKADPANSMQDGLSPSSVPRIRPMGERVRVGLSLVQKRATASESWMRVTLQKRVLEVTES